MSDTATLLERLQDEQSLGWHAGERPLVELYLAAHPELAGDAAALLDLLNHEVLLREERGEAPALEEYLRRFPHLAGPLRDLFEVHAVLEAEPPPAGAELTLVAGPEGNSSPADTPDVPGYEVLKELGRGGMGVVYLAWQPGLNRLVALKMIRAEAGAADLARFRTEAEAVARLEHPNIVRLYEVGAHAGRPYFSLEYVAGDSLAAALRGAPQPPRAAAALLEAVARAMQYAHQRGVVHRDLTPNNVLLTFSRETPASASAALAGVSRLTGAVPKIADFGLAKLLVGGAGATQTGDVFGTPSYMAPEQAAGHAKDVGPATDVYALGAILYEMLTGRPPFRGATPVETVVQVVAGDPVPPRRLQPGVPRDLETVCLKCLETDPRRRYAGAADLADDLRRFLDGLPTRARPVGPGGRALKWARRRPAVAALLAFSAAVTVAGFALVSWQWYQTQIAWGAEHEQRQAADRAREGEAAQRRQYQGLSARLFRDRGLSLCDAGDAARGQLWLARALEAVPEEDGDLGRAIRTNLAGCREQIHPLRALLVHEDFVLTVARSADGKRVATGGREGRVRLWDAATGDCLLTLDHPGSVRGVALSPDGRAVLAVTDGGTFLWDAATGRPRPAPELRAEARVLAAAFSPDGRWVVTGARGGAVRLWDAASGRALRTLRGPTRDVVVVGISRDSSRVLAAGDDSSAFLWSAAGELIRELKHDQKVWAATFSPDGRRVLTGSYDMTARLWDAADGRAVTAPDPEAGTRRPVVLRHQRPVAAVAFSPDGERVVTGGQDNVAQVWGTDGKRRGGPLRHVGAVAAVAFSPDGTGVLTGGWDQAARLWDAVTGEPRGALLPHQSEVTDVAFLLGGRSLLTRSRDRAVRLWQAAAPPRAPLSHTQWVNAVAFSPDGRTALTASSDKTARFWDVATGREFGDPLARDKGYVLAAAFAPDGKTAVTGCNDGTARVWDVATRQCLLPPLDHRARVRAVAVSPDGRTLLTGCDNGKVWLWDLVTGKSRTLDHHAKAVYAVAFSPDGGTFVTGGEDMTAQVWDTASRRPVGPPLTHLGTVRSLAYSADGRVLLTGSEDWTARLWRAATGEPLGAPLTHPSAVLAVAFGAGDRLVLTGCQDGKARLWDRASGHPVGLAFGHGRPVRAVAFHPGGQLVLTGCEDNKARFWPVPGPLTEDVGHANARAQALSGMALDARGAVSTLDADAWSRRRRQIDEE